MRQAERKLIKAGIEPTRNSMREQTEQERRGRAAYPRAIVTPSGRAAPPSVAARTLSELRRLDPDTMIPGWDWFEVSAGAIRRQILEGIHDRINIRGGAPPMGDTERDLADSARRAVARRTRRRGGAS